MKKYLKNMWVSYVLSLVLPFMLFICEPIIMFANNVNDFWFDIKSLLGTSILAFLIVFIFMSILFNIIYFISKKALKIVNVIAFIVFLCTYIQGNYLVGHLPVLDGSPIVWNDYMGDIIISIILWVVIITISIIISIKFKLDNYNKYSGYITLAIFAMLSVSLISTFFTTDILKEKERDIIPVATEKNINKYSKEDNFVILLLDAVDTKYFEKAMKNNPDLASSLKDFTYYPDTMSMHPFTMESIPLILSGNVYENQSGYTDYVIDAMKNSKLLNSLYDNNYEVNIYEPELYFYDKDALKINNMVATSDGGTLAVDNIKLLKNIVKYDLFRYLPFFLKQYSHVENLNFKDTKKDIDTFKDGTVEFTNYFNNKIENSDKKNFKFMHVYGAHVPFSFNKDLENIENGTYFDEVEGCLAVTKKYIDYLKDNNIYDNTKIIIMADHGYAMNSTGAGTYEGRQNPILFIKGKNEVHDEMVESDKKISFYDLSNAYIDLINNKKSNELFSDINNSRTRRYLFYIYGEEDHMIEYETKGKAWKTNKMYKTGKVFDRAK